MEDRKNKEKLKTFGVSSNNNRPGTWKCSMKKMFSKISQKLQENTCARVSFLIKFQACSNTGISQSILQNF